MHKATIAAALALSIATAANASPIQFTDTTTASGTIGGVSFTDAAITVTATADTADIQPLGFPDGYTINNESAAVTIGGVGRFTFATATGFFVDNDDGEVGFAHAEPLGLDLVDGPQDPALYAWDMSTALGPITGDGDILQWAREPVMTSGGLMVLDDADADVTFAASVPVPEPGSLVLLLVGVAMWRSVARRRP